ncbi:DUF3486 family protein [Sedimenticola hydrogenitrophicus]|uniref:DUF3486 family protein n=1 Tax=Sedimenticola hydrogenitrophicus TaxID=2967975 RepID=UPI0023AF1FD1|nr:DUF3486 family protein [Sedimenticola hydrogenitrophicus]
MSRPSTIDLLPTEVRDALHAWLRDPAITQTEATDRLNALLGELGAEQQVSRHAVNRYDLKMREVGERLRQSRQVAEAWVGKLGAAPQGQLGHLINETLRTLAFELTMKLAEGELTEESMPAIIDQLKHLSLSVVRLERASSENVKREEDIRKQERARAAEAMASTAKQSGVSAETIERIRRDVLGMAE